VTGVQTCALPIYMSELQIRKIVYSLLQAGLVEIIRPPRPTTTPTGGRQVPEGMPQPTAAQMQRPAVKRGIVQKLISRIREL